MLNQKTSIFQIEDGFTNLHLCNNITKDADMSLVFYVKKRQDSGSTAIALQSCKEAIL